MTDIKEALYLKVSEALPLREQALPPGVGPREVGVCSDGAGFPAQVRVGASREGWRQPVGAQARRGPVPGEGGEGWAGYIQRDSADR